MPWWGWLVIGCASGVVATIIILALLFLVTVGRGIGDWFGMR